MYKSRNGKPVAQLEVYDMRKETRNRHYGFSLVELVIVIVIIAVIAAIAIPRFSRGAAGADESALLANLATMRQAIEHYGAEHGTDFPGAKAAGGTYGVADSEDAFKNQLILFTKVDGTVADTPGGDFKYGPYIRKDIPPLPVGTNRGSRTVKVDNTGPPAVDIAGGYGWIYNQDTGEIIANADDTDSGGSRTYDQY
jgi:general secretion pathway protein G